MTIDYTVFDPTGNITVLAEGDIPRSKYAEAAVALAGAVRGTEQVGFIEPAGGYAAASGAQARLQMTGGEFCANATMSLAAYVADRKNLADNQQMSVTLEVSGVDGTVNCLIKRTGESYRGTLDIPLPTSISKHTFRLLEKDYPLTVVSMPGICHIIAPIELFSSGDMPADNMSANTPADRERAFAEKALVSWSKEFQASAYGLMLFDEPEHRIKPLLYVPAANSLVWENCCGSGSGAVCAWLASNSNSDISVDFHQPGGTIMAATSVDSGKIRSLSVTENIKIIKKGSISV